MSPVTIEPPEYATNGYMSLLLQGHQDRRRILIGVPMMGLIRSEWALARWAQYIPPNWSSSDCIQWINQMTPLGYSVADARNLIVQTAVHNDFEWLFFIDSDVLLPPHCFVRLNAYMREGKTPVVAGLYFAKCSPAEPLVFRGRGNSYYGKWALGEKVWADGIPMGCTLIHGSVLAAMYAEAPAYLVTGTQPCRQVFDTPKIVWMDPEQQGYRSFQGTEDLAWCDRVIKGEFLTKAGWTRIAKKKYPFLIDTALFCQHIAENGQRFPLELKW